MLDVFSRRVIGWSMANHLRTRLVLDALDMALWQRRPDGVIHHSDQGSQYTSIAFGKRCRDAGVRPSTGSVGDCYATRVNSKPRSSLNDGKICEYPPRPRDTKTQAFERLIEVTKTDGIGWTFG